MSDYKDRREKPAKVLMGGVWVDIMEPRNIDTAMPIIVDTVTGYARNVPSEVHGDG